MRLSHHLTWTIVFVLGLSILVAGCGRRGAPELPGPRGVPQAELTHEQKKQIEQDQEKEAQERAKRPFFLDFLL